MAKKVKQADNLCYKIYDNKRKKWMSAGGRFATRGGKTWTSLGHAKTALTNGIYEGELISGEVEIIEFETKEVRRVSYLEDKPAQKIRDLFGLYPESFSPGDIIRLKQEGVFNG
jgi:uncharacterized protein (DUF1330 family)